ncbi:MAG: UDP-glucose 4-epimerase GalE [Planctomycetota bacterium]|nr:UDP-glucose 4-epimerase GalE [Planctomycetota bacterium]
MLVTGGCGYIGSHAVRALCEAGYHVVIFDSLATGHLESVMGSCDFKLYQGDLQDLKAVEAVFAQHRFQGVIHFAGLTLVGESVRDPETYYGANVIGGLNLLAACKRHAVPRFVFSSTAAVYGEPQRVPIAEDHALRPINPYGRTKLAFEHALESYRVAHDLEYVALRYFNAAGAHPSGTTGEAHDPETHLIPNAFRVALGQKDKLIVHGRDYETPDGTAIRDYIHVWDLALAHVASLEHLAAGGECGAFNLGTGAGHSVLEVIRMCEQVSGRTIPHEIGPRRPGDPPRLVADAERVRRILGFRPERSDLKTICEDAWRWHQAHPGAYR